MFGHWRKEAEKYKAAWEYAIELVKETQAGWRRALEENDALRAELAHWKHLRDAKGRFIAATMPEVVERDCSFIERTTKND
jgi:anti-sigma factor RsiW